MKKFLTIAAILALVMMLAVPAFAANSPVGDLLIEITDYTVTAEGSADMELVYTAGELDSQQTAALNQILAEGEKIGEVIDAELVWTATGEEVDNADFNSVTITFIYKGDGEIDRVVYWNESTGAWDVATGFTYDAATKTGTCTFAHFCDVVFLTKATSTEPTPAPAPSPAPSNQTQPTSPQTGDSTNVWMAGGIALAALAIACAVVARKKVTE